MRTHSYLTVLLLLLTVGVANARYPEGYKAELAKAKKHKAELRAICANSTSQIDQEINNVRARLLGGGDCWWDFDNGRYIVPKVDPGSGQQEVSSLYAGSVWLGGFDPNGVLKLACQDYRSATTNDFWPGPLTPLGLTDDQTCSKWDRHFKVLGSEIREHIKKFNEGGYEEDAIPRNLRGWPAKGNPYFEKIWGFKLPYNPQGLAGFYDADGDTDYDPLKGDYPTIEIRKCPLDKFPDEMVFWIYNDHGGGAIHGNTKGKAIQMEVQVQAFGYTTTDAINDMTFQRYKLINRATDLIDSCFFAMWTDPDLGCHLDDYVGCDTARSLMYVYNMDEVDGDGGSCACGDVPTYCENIPILGVDYFRGPLDTAGVELGMSSFVYYNNNIGSPLPGTIDPETDIQYYRYLTGTWKDGTPFTYGGSGYNPSDPTAKRIKYAFTEAPNDANGWSMCHPNPSPTPLGQGDRRTLQASGPFLLKPGAVNELIIGVPWVPDQAYPCPDIDGLLRADELAQGLFDNCFNILDGPNAPDADWVELNNEVVAVLTNEDASSKNYKEQYGLHPNPDDPQYSSQFNEIDFLAPSEWKDTPEEIAALTYKFEGYIIYQLANPNVSPQEYTNADKARKVYQVDVKNTISKIYNWIETKDPVTKKTVYFPEERINGENKGIRHTFSITSDAFGKGDEKGLVNHKKYYYSVVAYAHNNYLQFDPFAQPAAGQKKSYLEGRLNVKTYTVIPRPPLDLALNSKYGDGVAITRLEGVGAGGTFLELADSTYDHIWSGEFDSTLTYKPGKGPISVTIFNPYEVKNGKYELTIEDDNLTDNVVKKDAHWVLRDLQTNETVVSDKTIAGLNEQILAKYGFTVSIAQTFDAGDVEDDNTPPQPINSEGVIGADITYKKAGAPWLVGIPDQENIEDRGDIFDYMQTEQPSGRDAIWDPYLKFTDLVPTSFFVPYALCDWQWEKDKPYFSPAWSEKTGQLNGSAIEYDQTKPWLRRKYLNNLPNVDIVFTSDKSKWSRCLVVESASYMYSAPSATFPKPDPATEFLMEIQSPSPTKLRTMLDTRFAPSVGKEDNDKDGLPDVDNAVDDAGNPVTGMGWFPGYAIDVETGRRLNIFFGENSVYHKGIDTLFTGRDMMWNPTNQYLRVADQNPNGYYDFVLGGQHWIYVHNTPYDECKELYKKMNPDLQGTPNNKRLNIRNIAWACMPVLAQDASMLSYADGLIPNDVTVRLRVDNPYQTWWNEATGAKNGHPKYLIQFRDNAPTEMDDNQKSTALDSIKVVPNPYFAYSEYEVSQFNNIVKITNLPPKCTVTIHSIDGRFIRQYVRNEAYTPYDQINPDVEWDLKNSKGIPVASGVYLIHIKADGWGERTVKWFGVARQFDPSGL